MSDVDDIDDIDDEDEVSGNVADPVESEALEDADDVDDEDDEDFDDDDDEDDDDEDDEDDEDDAGNRVAGGRSRAVLDYIARSIVDDPDSVDIEVEQGRRGVTLRLHVAQDDMGKVIGRRGRVAQALRSVVRAAGARDGTDAYVDIVD